MFGSAVSATTCVETGAILEDRNRIYAVTQPTTHHTATISRETMLRIPDEDRIFDPPNPLDQNIVHFHVTVPEGDMVVVDDFLFGLTVEKLAEHLPNVATALDMVHT